MFVFFCLLNASPDELKQQVNLLDAQVLHNTQGYGNSEHQPIYEAAGTTPLPQYRGRDIYMNH